MDRGDVVGLTMIVNFSLVGAFFCALPLVHTVFRVGREIIWATNSALQIVYMLNRMWYIHKTMMLVTLRKSTRRLFRGFQGLAGLVVVALALNAANRLFHR